MYTQQIEMPDRGVKTCEYVYNERMAVSVLNAQKLLKQAALDTFVCVYYSLK